jgi:hypothetical protein
MKQIIQILAAKAIEGDAVAGKYLDYFNRIMKSAGGMQDICKKYDSQRMTSLIKGISIFGEGRPRRGGNQ